VYGYVKDSADKRKLVIDEPAAKVVTQIFALASQGLQSTQIAKILNDEGVPAPREYKKQLGLLKRKTNERINFWNASSVANIIRDEQYTGKLIFGKKRVMEIGKNKCMKNPESEWVVATNAIPVIITEEHFRAVNAIFPKASERKKGIPTEKLFSRKLKCGHCGMSLISYSTKKGLKYFCETPTLTDKYNCSADRLYEGEISEVVLVALQLHIGIACEASKFINSEPV